MSFKKILSILLSVTMLFTSVMFHNFTAAPADSQRAVPVPAGASFEQVDNIGIEGSKTYLYTASELYNPNPMLTPILYVYADTGFDTEEDALDYIQSTGLMDLAEKEKGALVIMNPIEEAWGAQDVIIQQASYDYIQFMGTNAKLSYLQMVYLIGEGHGSTFINQYMTQNANRVAAALTVVGGMPDGIKRSAALPIYIAGGTSAAHLYFQAVNKTDTVETADGKEIHYNASNPVEKVIINRSVGALNAEVLNDAWTSLLRKTVRQCVEAPQMYDGDWYESDEVFTLMERPSIEELGLTMVDTGYTWNNNSGTGWFEWVPNEALEEGTKETFPLVISMHGSNDHPIYEAESNGWVTVAGKERVIVVSPPDTSAAAVHAMIDELIEKYPIDQSRIFITGFSRGANATFTDTAFDHPVFGRYARFAGMAPMGQPGNNSLQAADVEIPYFTAIGTIDQYGAPNGVFRFPNTLRGVFAFNGMAEPAGEADAFWGLATENPATLTRYGRTLKTATYYNDGGVPMIQLASGEGMDHAHFAAYGEIAWDYFEHFSRDFNSNEVIYDADPENATFDINVDVLEWGSAATAVIIDTDSTVYADDIGVDTFSVSAVTTNPVNDSVIYDGERTITNAYVSTSPKKGAPAESGRYIVLELKYGYNATNAEIDGSAAIIYQSRNYWLDMAYEITQNETVAGLDGEIIYDKTIRPIYDDFDLVTNPVEGFENQQYRMYTPAAAAGSDPLPLVIFNHGAGETYSANGGGNEGSQLFANMGGIGWVKNAPEAAYVLVPQRGFSNYSRAGIVAFVQDLIDKGEVDADRIYVSGASAGGSETHSFLREYPDFFAGAIAIAAGAVAADQLEIFKHIPVWYVHGSGDGNNRQLVDPTGSLDNYNNLKAIGGNVRRTLFPAQRTLNPDYSEGAAGLNGYEYYLRAVFGTEIPNDDYADGEGVPYTRYPDPHWSWVPVLNNAVIDEDYYDSSGPNTEAGYGYTTEGTDGEKFMDWLFSLRRPEPSSPFDIIVNVLEWGSAATAVVIDSESMINEDDIDLDSFSVSAVTKNPVNGNVVYDGERTVTKAYVSATNEAGAPSESGRYIVLELKYGYNATPAEVDGSAAIIYQQRNYWLDMAYDIALNKPVEGLSNTAFSYDDTVRPIYDDFELVENTIEGFEGQKYRIYIPEEQTALRDGRMLPLVIFNHGAGENYSANGGGNEGSQLFANMGGIGWVKNAPEDAVVLVPQRSFEGYSRAGVVAFVQSLIDSGLVDGDRIYVSGASQGGQETHAFLSEFPDFFAGAIPICPASGTSMTLEQLAGIKNIPIWYVHSEEDRTVNPVNSLQPYERLLSLGARDVRRTAFPNVFGTEIPSEDYPNEKYPDGHWSWVMVLNNEFVENGGIPDGTEGVALMDWLFAQRKPEPMSLFDINIDVLEWGSAVTAVIIDNESEINADDIDIDSFSVSAVTTNPVTDEVVYDGSRTITKAYVNATGEKGVSAESGRFIVLELKYGYNATNPEVDGSSAVIYPGRNYWLDLDYTITLNEDIEGLTNAAFEYDETVRPIYDDFELVENELEGFEGQQYRMYVPEIIEDDEENAALPLVLFNHGGGETYAADGGGNEGAQLFANMGGVGWVKNAPENAYILVPQRSFSGYSRAGVIAFIQDLIDKGEVDGDRIYVAGPSAGGAETQNFLMEYPDFFAAAMPICSGALTEAQVRIFKHVPVWFVQGSGDGDNRQMVDPAGTFTSYNNLKAVGGDARRTLFPAQRTLNPDYEEGASGLNGYEYYLRAIFGTEIPNADYVDGEGVPYERYPDPHWSWIPVLNNVAIDESYYDSSVSNTTPGYGYTTEGTDGLRFMDWLFSQTKADDPLMRDVSNDDEFGVRVDPDGKDVPEGSVVIIAQYDEGDRMISAVQKEIDTEEITTLYLEKDDDCAYAKAFAWDNTDLPLEAPLEF